jgi:hypothetical protein
VLLSGEGAYRLMSAEVDAFHDLHANLGHQRKITVLGRKERAKGPAAEL